MLGVSFGSSRRGLCFGAGILFLLFTLRSQWVIVHSVVLSVTSWMLETFVVVDWISFSSKGSAAATFSSGAFELCGTKADL